MVSSVLDSPEPQMGLKGTISRSGNCVDEGRGAARGKLMSFLRSKKVSSFRNMAEEDYLCVFLWETSIRSSGREQKHLHGRLKRVHISVKVGFLLVLNTAWSCDSGLWLTNVSFLKGSFGTCEPRRQEAVHVSDSRVEWTMLQIGVSAPTRMPGLTGGPSRN